MTLRSTLAYTVALLCVALGGCFRALPKADPNVACDTNDQCPKGYVCNSTAHMCCLSGDEACRKGTDASVKDTSSTGGKGGSDAGGGGSGGARDARDNNDVPIDNDASATDGSTGLPNGAGCSADGACASGQCIDGVCCATACSGCNACSNALTGNFDGICAPVLSGKVAHNACADETATKECGNDGTCDGNGACRKVGTSHICIPASCSSDGKTFTPASTCDGSGSCTVATPQSCGLFQCALTGCLKTCSTTADCDAGNYCNTSAGTCAVTKPNGQPATRPEECKSGVIADGVCCDRTCTGCSACTSTLNGQAATTTGQCLPVVANKADPHGVCVAKPPCGQDGTCDGNGGCHYPVTGTACGTPSCSGSTLTTSVCDSSHACVPTPMSCPNALACASSSACKAGCSVDTDCAAGSHCASGTCKPTVADGSPCSGNNQCKNGNCVIASGGTTGICCNTACGTCNSCSTGTCKPVANGTACGNGAVCNGGLCGACSEGSPCNPTTPDPCHTYAYSCSTGSPVCQVSGNRPNTTACGPAQSCSGGTQYDQAYCLNGSCPAQPTKTCPSTGCGTTACNAACSTSQTICGASCCQSATQYCSGTACATKGANGQTCPVGNNGACQSNNCSNGLCCPSGQSNSGGICCGAGLTNSNGVCCASGMTGCNGTCVNTKTDTNHCGGCSKSCPSGTNTCISGTCSCGSHVGACSSGTTCCGDNCYNLTTSSSSFNCGTCGHSCLGDRCSSGACQPTPISGSATEPFNYPPRYSSGIVYGGHTYSFGYGIAPNGDQDPAIFRDGSATPLCIWTTYSAGNEEVSFYGLAADSNFLYGLLIGGPLGVFRCPIGGGTAVTLFEDNAYTEYGLVVTSTAIYWSQIQNGGSTTTRVFRLVK